MSTTYLSHFRRLCCPSGKPPSRVPAAKELSCLAAFIRLDKWNFLKGNHRLVT